MLLHCWIGIALVCFNDMQAYFKTDSTVVYPTHVFRGWRRLITLNRLCVWFDSKHWRTCWRRTTQIGRLSHFRAFNVCCRTRKTNPPATIGPHIIINIRALLNAIAHSFMSAYIKIACELTHELFSAGKAFQLYVKHMQIIILTVLVQEIMPRDRKTGDFNFDVASRVHIFSQAKIR